MGLMHPMKRRHPASPAPIETIVVVVIATAILASVVNDPGSLDSERSGGATGWPTFL
jgi:hypothetical protein